MNLPSEGYSRLLESPQWAKYTREIRQSHSNACQCCRMVNRVTQVHHFFYDKSRLPWEYKAHEVVLLCDSCHNELHEQLKVFRRFVFGQLTPRSMQVLNGALAVALKEYDPLTFTHALAEFVSQPGMVKRYAEAWGEPKKKAKSEELVTP